jgi:hypothetical protein
VSPPADEPSWFKPRIDQAKRSGKTEVLSALGVKDEAEAKALLDKARAVEEAAKTELQKAKEKADGFETRAKRADALEAAVKSQSDIELASLTEAQRAIVADIIGDDPATIVQKLPKLKASWATAAPAAAQAAAQVVAAPLAPAAPLPAPATTSPPPNAPGGSTVATPDHKAEYVALKAKNPHQAALYLNAYSDKIYPR